MATRRYGISLGERPYQVTEAVGAATAADSLELTVDFDALPKMKLSDVLNGLDKIREHIIRTNKWPPA